MWLKLLKPAKLSLDGFTIEELAPGDTRDVSTKLANSLMKDGRAEEIAEPANGVQSETDYPLETLRYVGTEIAALMKEIIGKDSVDTFLSALSDPKTKDRLLGIPGVSESRIDQWRSQSLELLDG